MRIMWLFLALLFGGCASLKAWCAADPKCAAAHEIEKTCHDSCKITMHAVNETDFLSVIDYHKNALPACTCQWSGGERIGIDKPPVPATY